MQFEIIPRAEADVVSLMKSIDKVVINPLIFLLFALAMVYFLYGVAQYLLSPDNEEVRKTSKSHMLWGLIGLFVMVGVFGILSFITSSLGVQNIKIQSNGDYTVSSTINGTTTTTDIKQSGLDIPQTDAPKGDANTSGVNLSKTQLNQNPGLDPTKSPFPDYTESSACWHKVIHSAGLTEYKATHATTPEGDELSMADYARYVYIKETGNKTTVNQNLPIIFDNEVLYGKNINFYYSWMDLRAPTKVPSSPGDCDLKLNPTQSSTNYTYLDKYKSSASGSTAVTNSAINPNLSPFPDYDTNTQCWNQEFALIGDTEYKATQNISVNGKTYITLSDYLRARFLDSTKQDDIKVIKSLPVLFDYQPLYDSAKNKYNVWIDVRAPIGTGTLINCNLKVSAIQGTGNYKLTGKYQSSDLNISAGQTAKNLDFTKSPLPQFLLNPSACWRKEILFKDKTEYKALESVDSGARTAYLLDTHQVDNSANKSYPIKYGQQTAFNSADQMYYVWVDERAPISKATGIAAIVDCNLTPKATLPQPVSQSIKPTSLSAASDASYFRVVDSGVSISLSQARGIAIHNALIQIGLLKGVNDLTGIIYRVVPPEKYYPLDATGNYDYFVVVESPK
jgi:hypothetical protein